MPRRFCYAQTAQRRQVGRDRVSALRRHSTQQRPQGHSSPKWIDARAFQRIPHAPTAYGILASVTEDFGELLRAARVRLGWDQGQVARQLGVGQQTVSRWERGETCPARTKAPDIARILCIEVQQVLRAMAASKPASPAATTPIRPLLTELPLGMLAEDVFERFSTDLAALLYPHPDVVHGYGSRGHKQYGIDVEICHPEGPPTGIQCKRAEEFGPADVQAAVTALTMEVRECIIFLSRKTASPGARKEIAKHPKWQLLDGLDISRKIRYLADQTAAIRLVETYFPGYRKEFLGIGKPSPWEGVDAFFRPVSANPLFTHAWELVGRARELDSLKQLFDGAGRRIGLVVGPGGIGKSRLVRQFGLDMSQAQAQTTVRFAVADTPVELEQFEQLPGGRLAVVVEDAHARSDSAAIAQGVLRRNPEARVVISVRPYALADLQNDLRGVGIYPDDCSVVVVEELTVPEAQALARQVLDDATEPGLPEWLGSVAPDCPLIIVVAAALVKRGALEVKRLPGSGRIRAEIMEAFRDAMTAGVDVGDPDVRREVLQAVAAFQPFRIDDDAFRSAMSAMAQRSFDQVMSYLSTLEAAQVLQRRGTSMRVVPDLLGDAVLAGACTHAATGIATGYLERAFDAADGEALAHLFVNSCRVDWQVRQSGAGQRSLVEPLWVLVNSQFAQAGIDGRIDLLKLLKKVAAFQPGPTFALARWAVSNPIVETESERRSEGVYRRGYQNVRNELAPLLENVAYNLSHLDEAADLLWELAATDIRKPNQFPDHPVRVLARLMGYAPTTPLFYQENLLAVAGRWLAQPEIGDLPHSPFDVLDVLLATEAVVHSSDGLSFTMRSYPVTPAVVRSLRGKVVDLAFSELTSPDVRRGVRAARTIGTALVGPLPAFNRVPDQAERDRWTPMFIEVISRVGSAAKSYPLHPVVVIALREALRWHYQYSSTETREAAQVAWRSLPDSIEHRLALIVHDPWGTLLGDGDRSGYQQQVQDSLVSLAIDEAIQAWQDDELLDQLEWRLRDERLAFDNEPAHAGSLMWRIAEERPTIGGDLCRRVVRSPDSLLRDLIPAALGRLLQASPTDGLTSVRELLAAGDTALTRIVANTLGWGRGQRTSLFDGEASILKSLIRHDDPVIRRHTIFAARAIHSVDPMLSKQLVATVHFADSRSLADDVASAFCRPGFLQWSELAESESRSILDQLTDCSSIDEYHITVLLADISGRDPEEVLNLLIRRIETWEQTESVLEYGPLPDRWQQPPTFTTHPLYGDYLRRVLKWMAAETESWRRQHAGGELFALMARGFGEEALRVLREALSSGDVRQVKTVGYILRQAPRNILWEQVEFVTLALSIADNYGEEIIQQVAGGLHAAAFKGMAFGTPQQPFEKDIDQRDKSTEVLSQLQRGSLEEKFYRALAESAQRSIAWKAGIDESLIDRRDW
jgi:ribosome-binding protein aMBF1 (putative translation factor)